MSKKNTTKYYLYVLVKDSKAVYVGVTKNTIIRTSHLTYFGDGEWYNSESILDRFNRDFYLRKEGLSNG